MRSFAAEWWDARWVIAFALVVFGANLSVSQMRGDAMIYAAVSKNLVRDGDPLRMTLDGEPYLNKPPLYFWVSAAVMGVVGTGPVGVKLGALLASTGLCVLLYRTSRRMFDDRMTGLLTVFVFSATYVVYRNTYQARMESLVTLLIMGSLACFWRWLEERQTGWALGWGLCAGLAVLTKGPVGLLPLGSALIFLLLAERDSWNGRAAAQLGSGLVLSALPAGVWLLVAPTPAEFLEVFVGRQVLDRSILGPAHESHRWWSVYWAKLFTYDLPWMILAAVGLRRAWGQERLRRPARLFLTAAVLHLVLIHLIEEKTARYLYQFYALTAGFSAFGLLALRRFDAEHLLKIVIVGFAIGLQFTGTSGGRNHFRPLLDANRLAASTGWPIVADAREFEHLDERAALDYYLERTRPPDLLPDPYILVRPRDHPMPHARTLFASDRIWVGLVQGAPYGPGPVEPMTSTEKGAP